MEKFLKSPKIEQISWGKMRVERIGEGKDFKLWPGGGEAWDWRETNTHHQPGILPADVEDLINKGSEVLVLSRGMLKMLHTSPAALALIKAKQIAVHIEPTKNAVKIYNQLAEKGIAVGGLFHSTC